MTTRLLKRTVLGAVIIAAGVQFVRPDRSNPAVNAAQTVQATAAVPPGVHAVLRRSCYDCHSSETRWPWYSRIAPVSWLVASDVSEARGKFNLSDWGLVPPKKQADLREDMWEEVEKGAMPLWFYRIAHPEARLTPSQEATLREWAVGAKQ